MSKFGKQVIVNPVSRDELWAQTVATVNGVDGEPTYQHSTSLKVFTEQEALSFCIQTIKKMYRGEAPYSNIELFSDMSGMGVSRAVITHMGNNKDTL